MIAPRFRCAAFALTLACIGLPSLRADGLLYKLPADGAWILYDMHFVQSYGQAKGKAWVGTMKISSVGRELALPNRDDQKKDGKEKVWARWIEFDSEGTIEGRPKQILAKMLIPEKYLKPGEDPTEHIIRGYLEEDEQGQRLRKHNTGPLRMFFARTLEDVKKLEPKEIECKLGKLKCEGLTGNWTYFDRGGETRIEYEIRLHDKAPFGTLAATIRMENRLSKDEDIEMSGTCKFSFLDSGTGAKSALPDRK